MSRLAIPESIKREVLTEAGFRCAVPTCRAILTLDINHINEVSEGGGNELSNLICLCPNCHALYHRQKIPRDSIRVWKNMLVTLNGAFDRLAIDDLLFLEKLPRNTLALSGDGVLKFSKLLAAGMAQFVLLMQNGPIVTYDIFLTPKGKMIVEAWKQGEKEKLEKAINS
jgi:hypothetical protein